MDDPIHVQPTRTGQAPGLAGALVVLLLLGVPVALAWPPAWLGLLLIAAWVGWER